MGRPAATTTATSSLNQLHNHHGLHICTPATTTIHTTTIKIATTSTTTIYLLLPAPTKTSTTIVSSCNISFLPVHLYHHGLSKHHHNNRHLKQQRCKRYLLSEPSPLSLYPCYCLPPLLTYHHHHCYTSTFVFLPHHHHLWYCTSIFPTFLAVLWIRIRIGSVSVFRIWIRIPMYRYVNIE